MLGVGDTAARTSPTQVGSDNRWLEVDPGYYQSCAVKTTRTLWCMGRNTAGQLGLGDQTQRTTPTQVGLPAGRTSVVAFDTSNIGFHTLVVVS